MQAASAEFKGLAPGAGFECVEVSAGAMFVWYTLVNKHSYGKWSFIVDFPIENGDVPQLS